MNTRTRQRRAAAFATALAVAGMLLPPAAAVAAEGPAPAPDDYRIIGGVHADVISTFVDDGRLALGSKADVDEGNGTRFDAEDVWFHLDDASQEAVPEGFDFVAPPGTTVWMAPESSPGAGQLWPGFNTESVSADTVPGMTSFTLRSVDGPGDVEVFTGGGAQPLQRLWSSEDASIRSFDMGRTHAHATWTFTAAGTYRLDVEGAATVNGTAQSASAVYTFIVGDAPEAVETSTDLSVSSASVVTGDEVTLTASVSPASSEGYVEFRSGSEVLGHEALVDGGASLTTSLPAVGTHALTAVFVPAVRNHAAPSTSEPLAVTVTDGSGVEFGIAGVTASYEVGDVLTAHVAGHTLDEGQTYMWSWRPIGVESAYVLRGTGGEEAAGRLTFPVDMSYDGYEISVSVRQGSTTVTRSPWIPLSVHSDVQPVDGVFPDHELFLGDDIALATDRAVDGGDILRLAYRYTSGGWMPLEDELVHVGERAVRVSVDRPYDGATWVLQTVRDGVVVAQSAPFDRSILRREVLVEGLQSVYRAGQTLRVSAEVHPPLDGMRYTWSLSKYTGGDPPVDVIVLKETTDPADLDLELPIEAHHDGWNLELTVDIPSDHPNGPIASAGRYTKALHVSDADPDSQLLFFESLGDHYHQGYDINLNLIADPAVADDDTVQWEWKWPGSHWSTLPLAAGLSHKLVAEQALHGVEVRARLHFSDGDAQTVVSAPVTIRVDDHGAPARQRVNIVGDVITGASAFLVENEQAAFDAEVSEGTVLDTFQWFLKIDGDAEAAPIRGAAEAHLDFTPAPEHDGAELSVAVMKPDGSIAYGPSDPITLAVESAGPDDGNAAPEEPAGTGAGEGVDGGAGGGGEADATTGAGGSLAATGGSVAGGVVFLAGLLIVGGGVLRALSLRRGMQS